MQSMVAVTEYKESAWIELNYLCLPVVWHRWIYTYTPEMVTELYIFTWKKY